ncbi:Phosphatidylinositol-4-phosphate 5-kinase [Balamuthia mandrillaris]
MSTSSSSSTDVETDSGVSAPAKDKPSHIEKEAAATGRSSSDDEEGQGTSDQSTAEEGGQLKQDKGKDKVEHSSDPHERADLSDEEDESSSSFSSSTSYTEEEEDGGADDDTDSKKAGSLIADTLGKKPKKIKGMGHEEKKEYKKVKREWKEKEKEFKRTLTPGEKKEYKKEKKELSQQERFQRKQLRKERRKLVKEKRKFHRPRIGKLVTKETQSYELVCDMLLGIRVTVSRVSARALRHTEVKPYEFRTKTNLKFPSSGSSAGPMPTPAHSQRDFKFTDYSPVVFRRLREHFGIDSADYLVSLTGDYVLSELVSPGQSGQFFYFSYDLRFMLKTITKGESKFLKAILPHYYEHIMNNPDSLLARFFGFHRVTPHKDRKHYFIIMGNIFAQNLEISYRFDLKGSSVGRVTPEEKIKNDPNVVMKDQDFDRLNKKIYLGPDKEALFIDQVTKDVDLLERLGIMDYSLLLGIHDRRAAQMVDRRLSLSMVYLPKAEEEIGATTFGYSDSDYWSTDSEDEYKHHITKFTQDQGGFQSTDKNNNPANEIYFMGIIDILQPYNIRKRVEHTFKALRYDGDSISAVHPKLYASRFKEYMFGHVCPSPTRSKPPRHKKDRRSARKAFMYSSEEEMAEKKERKAISQASSSSSDNEETKDRTKQETQKVYGGVDDGKGKEKEATKEHKKQSGKAKKTVTETAIAKEETKQPTTVKGKEQETESILSVKSVDAELTSKKGDEKLEKAVQDKSSKEAVATSTLTTPKKIITKTTTKKQKKKKKKVTTVVESVVVVSSKNEQRPQSEDKHSQKESESSDIDPSSDVSVPSSGNAGMVPKQLKKKRKKESKRGTSKGAL